MSSSSTMKKFLRSFLVDDGVIGIHNRLNREKTRGVMCV